MLRFVSFGYMSLIYCFGFFLLLLASLCCFSTINAPRRAARLSVSPPSMYDNRLRPRLVWKKRPSTDNCSIIAAAPQHHLIMPYPYPPLLFLSGRKHCCAFIERRTDGGDPYSHTPAAQSNLPSRHVRETRVPPFVVADLSQIVGNANSHALQTCMCFSASWSDLSHTCYDKPVTPWTSVYVTRTATTEEPKSYQHAS